MPDSVSRVFVSLNPSEPDGLVVEGPHGFRLVAVPTAVLDVLRVAQTIQYTREGRVYRMRVGDPIAPTPSPTTPPPADHAEYELAAAWQCPAPKCGWYNVNASGVCGECGIPKPDPK